MCSILTTFTLMVLVVMCPVVSWCHELSPAEKSVICPSGWFYNPHGNHCLKILKDKCQWDDCREECWKAIPAGTPLNLTRDVHLATVPNLRTDNLICSKVFWSTSTFFLGILFSEEDIPYWNSTGEALEQVGYNHFVTQHTEHQAGTTRVGALNNANGTCGWIQSNATEEHRPICEVIDVNACGVDSDCKHGCIVTGPKQHVCKASEAEEALLCPPNWRYEADANRCITIIESVMKSETEAREACKSQIQELSPLMLVDDKDIDLVTIDNALINSLVCDMISVNNEGFTRFYIGLNDIQRANEYRWRRTNEIKSYDNFRESQPNDNTKNNQPVVGIEYISGQCSWNDWRNDAKAAAICEIAEPNACWELNGGCPKVCVVTGYKQKNCSEDDEDTSLSTPTTESTSTCDCLDKHDDGVQRRSPRPRVDLLYPILTVLIPVFLLLLHPLIAPIFPNVTDKEDLTAETIPPEDSQSRPHLPAVASTSKAFYRRKIPGQTEEEDEEESIMSETQTDLVAEADQPAPSDTTRQVLRNAFEKLWK